MKKLVGISLFSIALLAVSCQKEDSNKARMESGVVSTPPTWKKGATPDPESNFGTNGSGATSTGNGITDPNNDPDMNSKKGNKQ
jgi:hypothetical protein